MKFAVVMTALISLLSLSSCLNDSDNSSTYDLYDYVTLKQNYGEYYLISDNGIVYKPISTTVLSDIKLTDGTYLERFVAAIKLGEGETITAGKTSYNISKIGVSTQIVYQPMTTEPDTIKGDYGIANISNGIWAANGYVTVPLTYYYSSSSKLLPSQFNLYATGTDKDTLFVTLQQSRKIESNEAVSSNAQLFSFSLPFNKGEFYSQYGELEPQKDSIVIKLSAKAYDKVAPIVKTTKYKYTQR